MMQSLALLIFDFSFHHTVQGNKDATLVITQPEPQPTKSSSELYIRTSYQGAGLVKNQKKKKKNNKEMNVWTNTKLRYSPLLHDNVYYKR